MEDRNYSEKDFELAKRILKLQASYCARFWAEKLTDPEVFWSCKREDKNATQTGTKYVKKNIKYVQLPAQQIFMFIKAYEKLAEGEISKMVKNEKDVAAILGYSEQGLHPGFTSGIKDSGVPEYFLGLVLKKVGIFGFFLGLQGQSICIKNGELHMKYHAEKSILKT